VVHGRRIPLLPLIKVETGHDPEALEEAYRASLRAFQVAVDDGASRSVARTIAEQVRADTYNQLTEGKNLPNPFDT